MVFQFPYFKTKQKYLAFFLLWFFFSFKRLQQILIEKNTKNNKTGIKNFQ
jgi:hypothetical protein